MAGRVQAWFGNLLRIRKPKFSENGPVPRTTPGVGANRPAILSCSKTTDGSCHRQRGLAGGVQREGRRESSGSWRVGAAAGNAEPSISWVFCEPLWVRINVGGLDQRPSNGAGSGNSRPNIEQGYWQKC